MKKQANRAANKVAIHPRRLTIKVRLSPSELLLAAKGAAQQKRTAEEIVEDFLLKGTGKRPKAIEERAARGRCAGPSAEDWRTKGGLAKG